MPRHKADTLVEPVIQPDDEVTHLKDLLAWIGDHIHVRNANGQRTTAKCALCPFTYKKDSRGRSIKEQCRHNEIWQLSK